MGTIKVCRNNIVLAMILVATIFLFFMTHIHGIYSHIGNSYSQSKYLADSKEIIDLGTFVKGEDYIEITGKLVVTEGGEEIPVSNEKVYLYLNKSEEESELISECTTGSDGDFYFRIFVDMTFPEGVVYFTVYYPGSVDKGYGPTRIYYKATITIEMVTYEREGGDSKAYVVIALLLIMMASSAMMSLRQIMRREKARMGAPMWREILTAMTEQARRRDINFVLLVRELIDSLCRELGIIPKVGAPIQERAMALEGVLEEDAYNILKNMVAIYELLNYGGPYARTILMSSIDFDVWHSLLNELARSIEKKLG